MNEIYQLITIEVKADLTVTAHVGDRPTKEPVGE